MKKTIAILLCLVMLVSCFAACGKAEETPAADNNAAAPEAGNEAAPEAGNEAAAEGEAEEAKRTDLKVQLSQEPATLDFHQDQNSARSYIGLNLFANLVTYDLDGSIIGEMAESWSHNDDLTEWTFVIKQGAKFSDGSEITMDDVLYSFQRGKDLAYIPEYSQMESIEAISDTEIKFTLNAPNGLFANVMATDSFCVLSKAYMEGGADLTTEAAVTSGAYYLDQWNMGSNMILKANEGYVLGAPEIKEVELVFITDRNTAVVALESGDVDFITNGGTLSASEVEVVSTFDGVQFIPRPSSSYVFMSPNFNFEPFSDVNVRKAVSLAIDREYILAMLGGEQTVAGLVPVKEEIGGYLPGYEPAARDVEAAKALLAQSSQPNGFTFKITCVATYVPVAEAIQAQLGEIGITVEIDQAPDTAAIIEKINNSTYEAFMLGYTGATGDIGSFAGLYNAGYNWDPVNEHGPIIAASTGYVGAERDAMLAEAYDMITDTVPYIGLYWNNGCWACDENLDYGVSTMLGWLRFRTMSWN